MFWTIVIGGCILILVQWLMHSPFRWAGKGIQWLLPWPIFGNTAGVINTTAFDYWLDFYKKTEGQKMFGFHYFMDPAILLRDPQLIKQVMISDADSYMSHGFFVSDDDPIKAGMFFSDGEEWKATRAKMNPFFSPSRIKGMWSIIEHSADEFVKHVVTKSKSGPFDIDDMAIRFTTDTVVSTAFGLQPDSFVNPRPFFYCLQRELLELSFALRSICGTLSPKLYSFLGLNTFKNSSNEKLCGFINQVFQSRSRGEGVRPDFIQGMVELSIKEMENISENDKVKYYEDGTLFARFDKRRVTAQCISIFSAAIDTTGHTMSFLLYELAMNQSVQDKLRMEILETEKKCDGSIGYDELKQMVYLDMLVNEILRMYPCTPGMTRKCTRPTRLGDVDIAKGTWIWIPFIGIQRDSKYYPNPDKFDPERFSPEKQKIQGTFLTFGLGPRICIGMTFAVLEMKMAVYKLIKKLKLTPCDKTPSVITSFGMGIILYCPNGITLNAEPV